MRLDRVPRFRFDTIGSTSAEAQARLRNGTRPPFWVTATEQTSGRGRSGRDWISPKGNLYASLAFALRRPLHEAPTIAFAAALAVFDVVHGVVRDSDVKLPITLKWPNDVLCDGAKISGLLLESTVMETAGPSAVIGCGINCRNAPEIAGRKVAALADFGLEAEPDAIFERLDQAMRTRLATWSSAGFAGLRDEWLSRATGIGQPISVRLPDDSFDAVFDGLAPDGALIARLPSGARRLVSAGEVFLAAGAQTDSKRDN